MIHTSYTVGIPTGQFKALESVMVDQKEWITNAILARADLATKDIINKYSQYKIDRGAAITAIGSTAIIEAAYAEGVIKIVT